MAATPPADSSPAVYMPGEAYEFLGGTDALDGPRLSVAWTSPGVQRISIRVAAARDLGAESGRD